MNKDYDLDPEETEKIDEELLQTIGVEIHKPFLAERFSDLLMETESPA